MKLICKKYQWAETTQENDVNFFSEISPTFISEIDLFDYLIQGSSGSIGYNFNSVDENNALFYNSSNYSFQCADDIFNGTLLTEFFEIFNANDYVKYKLDVYDNNNILVYSAIILKNGIDIPNMEDRILNILSVGYEKEFSEYYSNKIIIAPYLIPTSISLFSGGRCKLLSLQNVLYKNFPNVQFGFFADPLNDITSKWFFALQPYTYAPFASAYEDNIFECKAGYESFYIDKINRFELLNSICLSLGWKWYFYKGILKITENVSADVSEYDINYNDSYIEHSILNDANNFQNEYVIIKGGKYYANYEANALRPLSIFITTQSQTFTLQGQRNYIFSYDGNNNLELRPYRTLSHDGGGQYLVSYANHTSNRLKQINDYTYSFDYEKLETNNFSPFTLNLTPKSIFKSKAVEINVTESSQNTGGQLDLSNARSNTGRYYGDGNSYGSSGDLTNNMYGYTGTVGEAMVKKTGSIYQMYESYLRQPETANNFRAYMKTKNKLITKVLCYDTITNPEIVITISNYPFYNFDGKYFAVSELLYNIIENKTNLTLIEV